MPTFTEGNDTYLVHTAGTFDLDFLGGGDTLTVQGGTSTTAHMGTGNDVVQLKSGLANVFGDAGADRFDIYAANATADGGGDNDLVNLRGGSGVTAHGGLGDDRFNFYADTAGVTLYGDDGDDDFFGYNHDIAGSLFGGAGNDYFVQFRSGATLHGGLGNDIYRITVGSPATILENSGEGIDTVQVARGYSYSLPDNVENVSVLGFSGSVLTGALLLGNALDNRIVGNNNDEEINGQWGNDTLIGKGGNDTLLGSLGADSLSGGAGADEFIYEDIGDSSPQLGYDTIRDFEAGVDWIDLLEIDANGLSNGNDAFNTNGTSTGTPGDLWITPYGAVGASNYMIYGDVNGDGQPDFQIRIHLVSGSIDQINFVY